MLFSYVAYNIERGVVKGTIEARSEAKARAEVARQGLKPLRVILARRPPSLESLFPSLFRVGVGELARFCRQIATMLGSGGSLMHTLEMLQKETRHRIMRRTLEAIRNTLDDGDSFSHALSQHPNVFTPLFISVVEVGEYSGGLGPALEQLADILEKEHEARQKAVKAMVYPLAIVGLSLVTLGVLVTVALPPLLEVFKQMEADIPVTTKMALGAANWVKANFINIIVGSVAGTVAFRLLRHIHRVRYWLDTAQARAPVLGDFIVTEELGRFARTIAMLLAAGVPLYTALKLGINGCKNLLLRRAFADANESLMSGHSLAAALKLHPIIPSMFVQLVTIGEESNSLIRTMNDAANAYQKECEQRLNKLLGVLEPVSTVVVGGLVAFIAFSMFVPIYSGMNAIK